MDDDAVVLDVGSLSPREVVTIEVGPTRQLWHISRVGRAEPCTDYVLGVSVVTRSAHWGAIAPGAHPFDVQIDRRIVLGQRLHVGPQRILETGRVMAIWRNGVLVGSIPRK